MDNSAPCVALAALPAAPRRSRAHLARSLASAQFTLDSGYPKGGTASGSSPSSQYVTNGGTRSGFAYGTGADSCSGPIQFSWTWQGSAGTAPSQVVLKLQTTASWTGPPGQCNDGLGQNDPTSSGYAGPTLVTQTQSGTKYVVASVSGNQVTYSASPSASATSSNCSVSATITVITEQETGSGPVDDGSGGHKMAIGQLLSLHLVSNVPSTPSDTYTWSVSGGALFSGYQGSASQGVYSPFTVPSTTSDSLSCYFAKQDTVTVTCTHYSAYAGQTITSTYTVNVRRPTPIAVGEACGSMRLLQSDQIWQQGQGSPTSLTLYGVQYQSKPMVGMYEANTLLDPSGCGRGVCGYVQLADRTSTKNSTSQTFQGLDGGFLYYDPVASDGTTVSLFDDTPGLASFTGTGTYSGAFSGIYRCYFMYRPADDAAGASVYVPIFKLMWNAKGHCGTSDGINWIQDDDGSGIVSRTDSDGSRSAFPEWP